MPASTTPPGQAAPAAVERGRHRRRTGGRRWALATGVTRVVIVAATVAALGGELHHALETTSSLRSLARNPGAVADERQTSCWASEVTHLVPRRALVYVGTGTVASQRLAEAVALWAVPTNDARTPLALSLQPAAAAVCGGVTVAVSRP